VHLGDATLHPLPEVSRDRLERVFEGGAARVVLFVDVAVMHGRDTEVDVSSGGFECTRGPVRIAMERGQPFCVDGPPWLRARVARLIYLHMRPMLTPTTPPATPLAWVRRTFESCLSEVATDFDGGPLKLVVGKFMTHFGGLVSGHDYAPLGWMPPVDAPVRREERAGHGAPSALGDLAAFAAALGLPLPTVLHREWYVADPSTRARGFYFDSVDVAVPPGEVEAAYGRSGSWHLRLAKHTSPDGRLRWSFIAQDERGASLVRGRAESLADGAKGVRVTVHSHADHAPADALLASLDAKGASYDRVRGRK
jgi:hypothetical protein